MQHKGVQPRRVPAGTHALAETIQSESTAGRMQGDNELRISYGSIAEVNDETSKVRVDIYDEKNRGNFRLGASKRDGDGFFIPILQPMSEIHHRFGQLRKGLGVRIYWRGKNRPSSESIAEIISDDLPEIFKSGKKQPESNEIATAAYKVFQGGAL